MSHRRGSLGGLNIHQAAGATKPVALQKRVRAIATTLAVVARAMNCGLTAAEARSIAVCNVEVAAATLIDPERKDAILEAAAKATARIVERAMRRAA